MKNNGLIIILIIILSIFSMINLYNYDSFLMKQIIWYIIGFIIYFIFKKMNKKYIFRFSILLYIVLNVLLLYLLLFGKAINGTKAWINIFGSSFQPSEFMKVILIIVLGYTSTKKHYLIKSIILTLIPSVLTYLEPETGNVIFYIMILFSVIYYKNPSNQFFKKLLAFIIFIGSIIFSLTYYFSDLFISLFGNNIFYRIDRVVSLFTNSSYQLNQALMSIGSAYYFGGSYGAFIPEAITDFAFALLISKIGFVGIIVFLIVNYMLDLTLIKKHSSNFGIMKTITFSFVILKIVQESIHMLMNIGLFPITGITLPFISYGGSSILSYFLLIGVISNSSKDYSLDME